MSSADIAAAFQTNVVLNHMENAVTTLTCYEYIFNLKHEVALLWRRRWTGVTWLFVLNRYVLLVSTILTISPSSPQTCVKFTLLTVKNSNLYLTYRCYSLGFRIVFDLIQLLPFVITATFSSFRVYVLLDRTYLIPSLVLLLGMTPAITNAYLYSKLAYYFVNDPVLGASCYFTSSVPGSAFLHLATRLCLVIADATVLAVTWTKTYSQVRQAASLGLSVGISSTLLRDGSLYFLILLLLNVLQLLIDIVPSMENANPVSAFTQIMPSILISRFIIDLRQVDNHEHETTMDAAAMPAGRFSQFSMPQFRMPTIDDVVGNMGEPLDHVSVYDGTTEDVTGGSMSQIVESVQEESLKP